jgi:hypothetical protein
MLSGRVLLSTDFALDAQRQNGRRWRPWQILECEPKCGILSLSHDEKKIAEIAIPHAKKAHGMAITEQ